MFDGNRLADHKAENRRLTMGEMLIEGSKSTLRLNGDGELWLREHGTNDEVQQEFAWQNRNFGGDCVFHCQQHLVEHLRSGSALSNSGADYLANIRAEQAVYESSAAGQRIELGAASAGAGL